MNVTANKPYSICEIGKRFSNQNMIFPSKEDAVHIQSNLFLVCDGAGNSNKGKMASSLACSAIHTYFHTFLDRQKKFDPEFLRKSVAYAEILFDEYVENNPEAIGMSATLALAYIAKEGVFVAYAGDSRIYQFRNGRIVFRTKDRSIHNTIKGTKEPAEINIQKITGLCSDDIFFLCTGGVTESLSDEELSTIMVKDLSPGEKMKEIQEVCGERSLNNHSAYLIPILTIEKRSFVKQVINAFLYAFV